jgi:hypothetical protein
MFLTKAPPLPQWPTGAVTGYENAPGYNGTLTDGSAITVQSNTTYVGYVNLGNGNIGTESVPVQNVTCIGCCWPSTGPNAFAVLLYGRNLKFVNCTTQPGPFASWPPALKDSPVPQDAGYQYGFCADGTQAQPGTLNTWCEGGLLLKNCDMWGFGNGGARLANGSTQANPYLVDYNNFHNLRLNTSGLDHNDGIGAPGGGQMAYLQLTRNAINALGDTNAIVWGSAANFLTNCLISGNLIGGFGFTVALHNEAGQLTNLTFTNNTYTTQWQAAFGPLYDQTLLLSSGLTWKGNRWLVPPGAQWGHSQYSGYFWLPGYTSNASPTFDELSHGLVGTSDFM